MTIETIQLEIQEVSDRLLQMARDLCWNTLSDECFYIISEIKNSGLNNFNEINKIRQKKNEKKHPKSLDQVVSELKSFYNNLYDLNLCVYKAKRKQTIIEIQYYLKSSWDKDTFKKVEGREPTLTCKVLIPPYSDTNQEKFDINWEFGGFRHKWKMFLWRQKNKKYLK